MRFEGLADRVRRAFFEAYFLDIYERSWVSEEGLGGQ